MNDPGAPYAKHHGTLKEHLAGVKGAHKWIQELSAQHLLDSQDPIKNRPVNPPQEQPK